MNEQTKLNSEVPASIAVTDIKNVNAPSPTGLPRMRGELEFKAYLVITPAQLLKMYRIAKKTTGNQKDSTALIKDVRLFIFEGENDSREDRIQICSTDFTSNLHMV